MAVGKWGVIITYRGMRSGTKGVRKLRKIVRDALKRAVHAWWKNLLPQRFRPGARGKFKLTPRGLTYDRFKQEIQGKRIRRWAGHPITPFWVARNQPRDFVLSGQTQQMATSQLSVTGTYKKAKGTIRVPQYFSIGAEGSKRVAELMNLTQREAKTLAKLVDRLVQTGIQADRTTEKKVITA